MLFSSFYPPIRTLYGDIACQLQPKINQVFEQHNSHQTSKIEIDNNVNGNTNKDIDKRKSKGINIKDVILKVDSKSNFEPINNDNETHQMIRGLSPEINTDRYDHDVSKIKLSKTKPDYFFFEVFLMNKYLQFFEYSMDILDEDQVDDSDTIYKMIVDFIELIISADHSLHIQQNYTKSIDLFKKLSCLLPPSSHSHSLIDSINKYSPSSLFKSIVFPSSLKTSQIFAMKIYHSLHFIYFAQKDYAKQEEEINKILLIDPNDYYAMFGLALVRYSQSKFPEAETLLNEVQHSCKDKDCLFHIEKFTKLLTEML